MRYRINKENYHRFDIMQLGKLPARSYFIPFSDREAARSATVPEKRYISDKVRCLNGQWDFKFYPKPSMVPRCWIHKPHLLIRSMFLPAGSSGGMTSPSMSMPGISFRSIRRKFPRKTLWARPSV